MKEQIEELKRRERKPSTEISFTKLNFSDIKSSIYEDEEEDEKQKQQKKLQEIVEGIKSLVGKEPRAEKKIRIKNIIKA